MQLAGAVILVALMQPVGAAVVAPPSAPSVSPVQPPLAEDAPWPVARGDARNTGRLRDGVAKALAAPVSPWRFPVDGAVVAVPVIDGAERIYVGTTSGTLHVFDPFAGREPWRVALGEPISAAAALGHDREIYVAAGAHLAAVSVDGATRWAFDARRDRDRSRVTLGVGDNWQGGIAISPDGDVCAGNDDFFVYCLDARGRVAWARRVGLPIWAPVAFGHDGTAYVPSLDMNLYALAAATGAVRWRRDLGAPLATAAAVGDDGTLYVGATDGQVHALDGDSGTVRWSTRAGAPVLAPPAVATDGTVYVASTDGRLAALDAASGAARWTYWFADRLRTAPAIGPDPEGRGSHLVYVGGGDGGLYALAPDGRPRWVYEPAAPGNTAGRPAIESGPALGRYGAAVGTAAGAVHYVPYDYYLRDGASNVRRPAVPAVAPAPQWRVVEPDGSLHERPLTTVKTDANPITVGRTEVVTLRALQTERPATGAGEVPSADGFEVRTAPGKYRVVPLGDRLSLALVPRAILPGAASLPLSVSGRFAAPGGADDLFEGHAVLQTEAESVENPLALGLHRGFRLTRLTVSQPPALAALLGPALHSIAIPFVVVDTLPARRTFAAWALQVSETGGPRLLSAWRGQWSGDAMVMEATSVFVAIAGIAVPIDRLRFAGRFAPGGQVAPGATLFAEVRPPGLRETIEALAVDGAVEGQPRTWFGEVLKRGGPFDLLGAAARTLPAVVRFVSRRAWEPLGLVNTEGEIVAVGTFGMAALPERELAVPAVHVRSIVPDAAERRVVAEVVSDGSAERPPVVAIMLVDAATGAPVAIDYNRLLRRERRADGALRVELRIPETTPLPPGRIRAHVMADLAVLASVTF